MYQFINIPNCPLTIHLPIYPSTHSPIYPLINVPIYQLTQLPIHPFIHLPLYPLPHLPIHLSTHIPIKYFDIIWVWYDKFQHKPYFVGTHSDLPGSCHRSLFERLWVKVGCIPHTPLSLRDGDRCGRMGCRKEGARMQSQGEGDGGAVWEQAGWRDLLMDWCVCFRQIMFLLRGWGFEIWKNIVILAQWHKSEWHSGLIAQWQKGKNSELGKWHIYKMAWWKYGRRAGIDAAWQAETCPILCSQLLGVVKCEVSGGLTLALALRSFLETSQWPSVQASISAVCSSIIQSEVVRWRVANVDSTFVSLRYTLYVWGWCKVGLY